VCMGLVGTIFAINFSGSFVQRLRSLFLQENLTWQREILLGWSGWLLLLSGFAQWWHLQKGRLRIRV
ncbi:MAG: hypothetical protein J7M14_06570, partial [Planctomycetes bacterium]|nr:hypothetical protein [Planctomycetota bacterium]